MSNGLIHNNVRWAHQNGVALIAFLAIPKSKLYVSVVKFHNTYLLPILLIVYIKIPVNFASSNAIYSMEVCERS
jgi:Plavaka transposase